MTFSLRERNFGNGRHNTKQETLYILDIRYEGGDYVDYGTPNGLVYLFHRSEVLNLDYVSDNDSGFIVVKYCSYTFSLIVSLHVWYYED